MECFRSGDLDSHALPLAGDRVMDPGEGGEMAVIVKVAG